MPLGQSVIPLGQAFCDGPVEVVSISGHMRSNSHQPVIDLGMVAGAVIRSRLQLVEMPEEALAVQSGRHADVVAKLRVRHLEQQIPVHFAFGEGCRGAEEKGRSWLDLK